MIIVSQNKKIIVNFDRVIYISVGKDEDSEMMDVICYSEIGGYIVLGSYDTNERASEVLDSIVNSVGLKMYKYQMPKK